MVISNRTRAKVWRMSSMVISDRTRAKDWRMSTVVVPNRTRCEGKAPSPTSTSLWSISIRTRAALLWSLSIDRLGDGKGRRPMYVLCRQAGRRIWRAAVQRDNEARRGPHETTQRDAVRSDEAARANPAFADRNPIALSNRLDRIKASDSRRRGIYAGRARAVMRTPSIRAGVESTNPTSPSPPLPVHEWRWCRTRAPVNAAVRPAGRSRCSRG